MDDSDLALLRAKRGRKPALEPDIEEQFLADLRAGYSLDVLAVRLGKRKATLLRILKRRRTGRGRGRLPILLVAERDEMLARYRNGEDTAVLAADYGIHGNTVLYNARRYGGPDIKADRREALRRRSLERKLANLQKELNKEKGVADARQARE